MSARSRIVRRIIIALSATLVLALVAGLAVVAWVLRRPLPQEAGTRELPGLVADVTVIRDSLGVPHVYAASDVDLFAAQGYVHAQDRFFEMDLRRHIASGRLSELLGDEQDARESDTVMRTLGLRRVAETEWDLLEPAYREYLEAYAAGVNAYLADREASELGMEYTILGLRVPLAEVEPWTPVDTLTWLKAMAWDMRANYEEELERAAVYRSTGDVGRVAELFPDYPADQRTPIIPPAGLPAPTAPGTVDSSLTDALDGSGDVVRAALRTLDAVPTLVGGTDGVGSNSFVVAGSHTETGQPLLANDPHSAVSAPGVWHQVGLHCVALADDCTFDVSGFSLSGMPGVFIGQNPSLAWGMTGLAVDATDFFLERIYPEGDYLYGEGRLRLETRTEEVRVAGGDSFTVEVASTVHGPLIASALPGSAFASGAPVPSGSPTGGVDGYAVSLAWTALEPGRSMEALLDLARATTAEDVAAAAAKLDAPAQNIVFATLGGDIGYQAAGKVPLRSGTVVGAVATDGTWPRPGWDPAFTWEGQLLAENLPRMLNPEEGFIIAANQAPTVDGGGPFLSADFDYGFRSQRLRGLIVAHLQQGEKIGVETANALMMDSSHPVAGVMVPAILRLNVESEFVREAVRELRLWRDEGYPNDADSAGAAYFNTVWANVLHLTFNDELPREVVPSGDSRWMEVLIRLMNDPRNAWWDDVSTLRVTETRDEILARAVELARFQLTNSLAKDADRWRWGDLHRARFEHQFLTPATTPGLLAWLTNPTPFEVSGGTASVNATSWDAATLEGQRADFTVVAAPSMRMVADIADPDASTWVVATGVSGHPTSRHYADQIGAWQDGESFPWRVTRRAVDDDAAATLTLTPER